MNMTWKRLKIGTRSDGWRNKIGVKGKSMIRRRERELLNSLILPTNLIQESELQRLSKTKLRKLPRRPKRKQNKIITKIWKRKKSRMKTQLKSSKMKLLPR